MKAYVVKGAGEPVEEMDLPEPELKGAEVLVRITNTGVCHSDVHLRDGFFDMGSAGTGPITSDYPAVFGHEIVGTIEAVGPEASVKPGDQKYIIFPWIGCGNCSECAVGAENLCAAPRNLSGALYGGFAHKVWVPDEKYLIELGDLDPSWGATLACSGLTSYAAVNKVLSQNENDVVAVIGAGGLGLMTVAILKALGQKQIAVVDVSDENLEIAHDLGATFTFNSRVEKPLEGFLETVGGQISAAIDYVNNSETSGFAVRALRKGGKLVTIGLFGGDSNFPNAMLPLRSLTIQGNYVGTLSELRSLVELAQTSELPKLPVVEKPLSAETINDALDQLGAGRSRGRTVLVA